MLAYSETQHRSSGGNDHAHCLTVAVTIYSPYRADRARSESRLTLSAKTSHRAYPPRAEIMFGICRAISDSSRLHYTWSPSKTQRLEDRLQESFLQTALQDHGKTVTRLTTDLPDGRSISSFRIAGVSYGPSEDGTQAAPLVFIHGFGGGKSTWCPLLLHAIPDIPNRDIYCLDLPGMGASTACVHSAQRVFRSARKEATDGGSDLASLVIHTASRFSS